MPIDLPAKLSEAKSKVSEPITQIFLTPKLFSKHHELLKEHFPTAEIVSEPGIYMNMYAGWTEDQCDNTIYFVTGDIAKRLLKSSPEFFPVVEDESHQ